MKRMLALLALICAYGAAAETCIVGDNTWTYTVSQGKATLTGLSTQVYDKGLTIPAELNGVPVTAIGERAIQSDGVYFSGELVIPEGISVIEQYGFYNQKGFTSVSIPATLKRSGDYAFYGCTALKKVFITNLDSWCRVSWEAQWMSDEPFRYCNPVGYAHKLYLNGELLERISLPDTLTGISPRSFYGLEAEEVIIPEGVVSIGRSVFHLAKIGMLSLPASVRTFGPHAFSEMSIGTLRVANLENWFKCEFLSGVWSDWIDGLGNIIGSNPMAKAEKIFIGDELLEDLEIPDTISSIPPCAFQACMSLKRVHVPGSVNSIGNSAFNLCRNLEEVVLDEGVKAIGECAFNGCAYDEFVIPRSVYAGSSPANAISSPNLRITYDLRSPICRPFLPRVKILSSRIRPEDPTVLDVDYMVTRTDKPVKVRALAFEDGERSFAKVVRPESFIDGTSVNIGDSILPNVAHRLSWRVSEDWKAKLANFKVEIFVMSDELLPLDLIRLPRTETQPPLEVSYTPVKALCKLDALFWLYADHDLGLTVVNGVLKNGDTRLADGGSVAKTEYDATIYLYQKMGYECLAGDRLAYVRDLLRKDLPDVSKTQLACKVLAE